MTFTSEQKMMLSMGIPEKYTSTRKQGGANLTYIEGWQVKQLLNTIFGEDGWSFFTSSLTKLSEEKNDKGNHVVSYSCQGRLVVSDVIQEDVGFGTGISRSLGDAHQGAGKEAVTDALKRCASRWMTTGGALYDREKRFVTKEVEGAWAKLFGGGNGGVQPARAASASAPAERPGSLEDRRQKKEKVMRYARKIFDASKGKDLQMFKAAKAERLAFDGELRPAGRARVDAFEEYCESVLIQDMPPSVAFGDAEEEKMAWVNDILKGVSQ